ncbi:kinase-like domain-containing protein [Phaeosphaeria sp. MPI-PUGE-AT-0046c]|nr:kinase-like domain-containing protein [Phaeosphaeria sp. MPI-PUGE-AT-0046c]
MSTSKIAGAPPRLGLEPVESSASDNLTDHELTTPRILVHGAGIPLTASNDLATVSGHGAHVSPDGNADEALSLPSYVLSGVSAGYADGSGNVTAQSATCFDNYPRRDSIINPYQSSRNRSEDNLLSSPLSAPDTTSGAESDYDCAPARGVRRRRSFLHQDAETVVQSPVDDATRGGAQPQDDSEEDVTFSSGNTSFDSNEAAYEEARQQNRPYTNSLGPPARWDQGPSPEPSDVISDAGDQQALQLRHEQAQPPKTNVVRKHVNIEESLASLAAENCYDDLQTRIYEAFKQTRRNQGEFLPKRMLCSLVNTTSVAEELSHTFADDLKPEEIASKAEEICSETEVTRRGRPKIKSFRKIFALLVIIEATKSILQFLEEDISDLDLPLKLVKWRGIDGLCRRESASQDEGVPLECLRRPQWSLNKLRNFEYYQWRLLAPFFYQDKSSDVKHYKLNDHHILPFIPLDDMADEDTEREGGFGRVILVDIHSDHHNFREDSPGCKGFAIKQQMYEDHRNYFKKEMIILKKFSGERSHPHIVSLLATYEQFKKFHLIFSRAEGDLFTFWKELKRRPKINQRNILWMVEQCRGITDGLLKLHRLLTLPKNQGGMQEESTDDLADLPNQTQPQVQKTRGVKFSDHIQERVRTDSWERPASPLCAPDYIMSAYGTRPTPPPASDKEDDSHAKKYGRHGDITPGNILWFGDGSDDQEYLSGTLKLADFGQAELNSLLSKTQPKSVANTMTYRPPECDLQHKPIRQSYDIWCLGCVLLEFVAWMLGGKKLLSEFSIKRVALDIFQHNNETDTFFQVTTNTWTRTPEVVVKKSVTDFIDDLHRHANCTDFIHELLNMIKEKMLIVESSERKSCEVIWRCLDEMYQKCAADADYAASSNPWRIDFESVPTAVGLEHLDVTKDVEKELKYLPQRPRHHGGRLAWRNATGRIERRRAR